VLKLEKLEKLQKAKEKAEERATNRREKDYWEQVKRDGWGDKLYDFIKASAQNPALLMRTPHNLVVPPVCRYNQRVAMLRTKFKAEGKDPRLITGDPNCECFTIYAGVSTMGCFWKPLCESSNLVSASHIDVDRV
jgi:hypothetical protein